tara:strand:+ start:574 stop:1104 length:531 start_codon:yes stop_codon:yes gene_type:complete
MKPTINCLFLLIPYFVFTQHSVDQKLALSLHNKARNEVGSSPLLWSEKLEKDAFKYAEYLARTNNFKHSKTKNGENLTMSFESIEFEGTTTYIYSETPLLDASKGWYDEIKDYRYSKIKKNRWLAKKVGHYTQMVWFDTREVGIASARSKDGKVYVVARYHPAGNILGKFPYKKRK